MMESPVRTTTAEWALRSETRKLSSPSNTESSTTEMLTHISWTMLSAMLKVSVVDTDA